MQKQFIIQKTQLKEATIVMLFERLGFVVLSCFTSAVTLALATFAYPIFNKLDFCHSELNHYPENILKCDFMDDIVGNRTF